MISAITVMGLVGTYVFANNNDKDNHEVELSQYQSEIGLVSKISGEVIKVNENINEEGTYYTLIIRTQEQREYIISIGDETVFIKGWDIIDINNVKEGIEIEIYFKGEEIIVGPMILDLNKDDLKSLENDEYMYINILEDNPLIVNASAIVINTNESLTNVHVDVFNNDLISSDFKLRLAIHEDTIIVDRNNKAYEECLENKKLAVIYGASTRARIATPIGHNKVIVLGEAGDENEAAQHPNNLLDLVITNDDNNKCDVEGKVESVRVVEHSDM